MIEGPIQTNNSGLVFYFDAKEPKSYAGKPTTNYLTTALTPNSATKESFTGTITENSITAPDGTLTAHRFQVTSGYVYQTLTIPVGTTVTYSVWIKTLDVASTTSYGPYIWNYNAPTYGIVARDLSGVSFDWKRVSMTYTTLSHQSSFAISYAGTNGGMQGIYALWRPQLEYSSSATPFINGTRSNTQGLLDLVGGSTIDLTNASFDGNSNILFASNKVITATMTNLRPTSQITQECWFSTTSNIAQVFIGAQYGSSSNNSYAVWMDGANSLAAGVNIGGSFNYSTQAYTITTNQYYHFVHTYNGSTQAMYMNGVLVKSFATSGTITYDATNNTLLAIGNDWNSGYNSGASIGVIGYLPVVRIYNRALSAAEILKNFNSQRSRYNV